MVQPQNAAKGTPTKRDLALRTVLRTIAYTAVTLVLLNVNLFGLDQATREYSAVLFNLTFGPSYQTAEPAGACGRDPDGTVAGCGPVVIHFTEKALNERLGTNWPVSYLDHATLLARLLEAKPRGVVVDILFLDHRPSDPIEPLREQVAAYREAGIPLYFAALSHAPLAEGLSQPVQDCPATGAADGSCLSGEPVLPENTLWVDVGDGAMTESARSRGGTYFISYPPALQNDDRRMPSPAFKVHNEIHVLDASYRLPASPIFNDTPLQIFWNGRPHALTRNWYGCDAVRGLFARLFYAVTNVDRLAQTCPPLPTAKAAFFFGTNDPAERYWGSEEVKNFAEGRVVYYGANLPALGDQIVVPAIGSLPGVWAHAMAHDNLLRFGDNYKRSVTEMLDLSVEAKTIEQGLVIALILAAILFFEFAKLLKPGQGPANGGKQLATPKDLAQQDLWLCAQYPIFVILLFIALIFATWLAFETLNIYPINWIQLMGILTVIGALVWQRPVERLMYDITTILKEEKSPEGVPEREEQKPDDQGNAAGKQ